MLHTDSAHCPWAYLRKKVRFLSEALKNDVPTIYLKDDINDKLYQKEQFCESFITWHKKEKQISRNEVVFFLMSELMALVLSNGWIKNYETVALSYKFLISTFAMVIRFSS